MDAGFADFDFLIGEWTVENEFLKARLAGSTEWERFSSTARCFKVMDGHGNLDEIAIPTRGFTGLTLRLCDPATQLWSIYWSDTKSCRLFSAGQGDMREYFTKDLDIPTLLIESDLEDPRYFSEAQLRNRQ